jgi:hypothetical protein
MLIRPIPDRSGGMVVFVLAIPVYFASDPEGRRIVDVLRRADAVTAATAMTAYEVGAEGSRTLRRLVDGGIIGEVAGGRYFVNAAAIPTFLRVRVLRAAAAAVVALAAGVALLEVATRA